MYEDRPPLDPHPLSPYVAWAGHRNRDPILRAFEDKMPGSAGHVLEFASGSGMHINYFAPHFQHLRFQPSDKDETVFDNIKNLTKEKGVSNVEEPVKLDLTERETWPNPDDKRYDVIYCINIFQVAPVSIADGMMQCASQSLTEDGFLSIYGPFRVDGQFTTPSNQEFHETLQGAGVDEWGLKDTADLTNVARANGLELKEQVDMPANNFILIYGRA